MGMMDKMMALDEDEASAKTAPAMPEAQEEATEPVDNAAEEAAEGATTPGAPGDGAGEATEPAEGAGEQSEDSAFEAAVEKALTAMVRVMQTPEVKNELQQLLQNPDAESIARFALDLLKGIVERSRGQVSEDAIPAIAFETIAMIADLGDLPPRTVAEATQRLLLVYLQSQGIAQPEIEQVLGGMDFEGMADAAGSLQGQ